MLNIDPEVHRLVSNATAKREALRILAARKSSRRKALNVIAGLLALFSAAALSATAASVFGDDGPVLMAALIAFASGLISLLTTIYFPDEVISEMYSGSSEYLRLREETHRLITFPRNDPVELERLLIELQDKYYELDKKYDRFVVIADTDRAIMSQAPPPDFYELVARKWPEINQALAEQDQYISMIDTRIAAEIARGKAQLTKADSPATNN